MTILTTARRIDTVCAGLLTEHELSEGRFAALLTVSAEPGITPAVLAERLQVTRATVTGLLDGLINHALIERYMNPDDRRSLTLRITPAGEQLIIALTPQYADWLHELGNGINAEDHDAMMRTMATIQHNIKEAAIDN